jgi:type I restriction enzyme, R subunit
VTEADTCRQYVLPKLYAAGWDDDHIREQHIVTAGRIMVVGRKAKRNDGKRLDYLLRYKRDYPLAVVEAKAVYKTALDGLQQAIEYAQLMDIPFAYATNGQSIIEHDMLTGIESEIETFPSPRELWNRVRDFKGLTPEIEDKFLTPYSNTDRYPRYYQTIAIARAVEHILKKQTRVLLTLATGTGKTEVAFQICWKLHQSRWNRQDQHRRPRMLFLADRDVLVGDPQQKAFAPFGDARRRLEGGKLSTAHDMYFATYQSLAEDANRPGLYKQYDPEFFDLIVIDEAHRGSAKDTSSWRDILDHFTNAVQLGLTATPLRDDTRDTYAYFGNPIYIYSLSQGIQDGFLAPYQVRRIITNVDATNFRPHPGMRDARGREIPDGEYGTNDFERTLSLTERTAAVAKNLVEYLRKTDVMAKTLVFCVDQEHAAEMRFEIAKLMPDLIKQYPDYVCRVTSDEGDIGKGHLGNFQELERASPVILTSSKLLSTGIDAPTVQNVVIFRVIGTMSEFKQIIGRGTRVREDYGKLFFTIIDYTGSATQKFADPEFDGFPTEIIEVIGTTTIDAPEEDDQPEQDEPRDGTDTEQRSEPRKYYLKSGVTVIILHETVQELDAGGKLLRVVEYTKFTAETVQSLFRTPEALRNKWSDTREREEVKRALLEHGIMLEQLNSVMSGEDYDSFDLLCHIAFNAPLLTRKARAEQAKKKTINLFSQYSQTAQHILSDLLEQYANTSIEDVSNIAVFKLLPSTKHLNTIDIARHFGGAPNMLFTLETLQKVIYEDTNP